MRNKTFFEALHNAESGMEQEFIIKKHVNQIKIHYLILGMFTGIGVVVIALCI